MLENAPKEFSSNIYFTDECWLWTSYMLNGDYGQFTYKHKRFLAHRFSWELFNGPIPKGMCVLHKCDNPPCVNPDHLSIGTHQENMKDRDVKGRNARGEKSGSAKLTQLQVDEIRKIYKRGEKGEFSQKGLARKFGVSNHQIHLIVNHKNWKTAISA